MQVYGTTTHKPAGYDSPEIMVDEFLAQLFGAPVPQDTFTSSAPKANASAKTSTPAPKADTVETVQRVFNQAKSTLKPPSFWGSIKLAIKVAFKSMIAKLIFPNLSFKERAGLVTIGEGYQHFKPAFTANA